MLRLVTAIVIPVVAILIAMTLGPADGPAVDATHDVVREVQVQTPTTPQTPNLLDQQRSSATLIAQRALAEGDSAKSY
jgi:hypothetical protein